ncbi:MAG: peptide deformylase [Alphaproteobacteria bacterium]|nr:peptide deformylase [Alphaproteobacteria bacterium]
MTKLNVIEVPNPILYQKAEEVKEVTAEIKTLLSDMLETMYKTNGVGLAGNQVGVLKRLVVIDCAPKDAEPDPIKMVNPKITFKSEEMVCHNEGCLSIPREYADVIRHETVTVEYLDENGVKQKRTADGLLAIAIQHELDHLEGILFIDHLSPLKRKMLLKHLEKRRKRQALESQLSEE